MFMKITLSKKVLITFSLLISIVYTGVTSAHDQPGSLGSAAEATDMYLVTCTAEDDVTTDHLVVKVIGNSSGPRVSAQVFKEEAALNTTYGVDIGDKALRRGDGYYTLIVNKSAAGTATYLIAYHCQSASIDHTITDIQPLQDQ
jgi:hypothetical protein